MTSLHEAVERNDPDELLRIVDGLVSGREWEDLLRLQLLCDSAVERGKQLWGVSAHIDYRLALEAPGAYAGAVVTEDASRFLLGPLPEVAASTHTWDELAEHLPPGPARAITAHERVVRGDDLTGSGVDPQVLEIPLVLAVWEPQYAVATYRSDRADFPTPELPSTSIIELGKAGTVIDDEAATEALRDLVGPWGDSSNGHVDVVAVEGSAHEAIAALGVPAASAVRLSPAQAMAMMGWAGASGGAYARRRGAAAGRFAAWWAAAAVTGMIDDWPVQADDLGEAVAELRWLWWSDLAPATGWRFHLAAEDPAHGLAWAVAGIDGA